MSTSEVCSPPVGEPAASGGEGAKNRWPWLVAAALLAVWYPVINHLRQEWALNEQYRYGFVVPLLCLYLFSLRWADRPPASESCSGWKARGLALLLLASLLPLTLAEGPNPDWRLLSWTLPLVASSLTLLGIGYVGGTRWSWHFALPVLFVLVAVPWPMRFESAVIQLLMRTNAAVAVEMVNLFGLPAQQAGNLISLGSSTVGVDEACSGVRSLQTTLMVGLLLGELYRFPVLRRAGLLVIALGVALFWNLIRTLLLVGIAANWGTATMNSWHDRIGLAILVCSLGSIFGLAQIARWFDVPGMKSVAAARGADENSASARFQILSRLPVNWCTGIIVWVAFVLAGVELWYRTGEGATKPSFAWGVHWPADLAAQREVPIPHQTWRLMKFTSGVNRTWKDEQGRPWSGYYLEWAPGRTAQALAQVHRPDICLPAAGKTLVADRGTQLVHVQGMAFPFRHYVFNDNGTPLQVYFSLQQPEATPGSGEGNLAPYRGLALSNRLSAIRERRRNLGMQQLELGVWGISDEQESAAALKQTLERLVVARR